MAPRPTRRSCRHGQPGPTGVHGDGTPDLRSRLRPDQPGHGRPRRPRTPPHLLAGLAGRVWRSAPATAVTSVTTPAVTEVLAVELESRALRITGGDNRTPYLRQPGWMSYWPHMASLLPVARSPRLVVTYVS